MIVSGKVRVNACSFVLVGDESVIVAWSRVGCVCVCVCFVVGLWGSVLQLVGLCGRE